MNSTIGKLFTAILFLGLCLSPVTTKAQVSKVETAVVKDGYVMIDGKMMTLKDGKMTKMTKNVTMENGTKVKKNGAVKISGKKRMKMKNGNCIDNTGSISDCNINARHYTCTHHPDVRAAKDGKCPKCGMDLVSSKSGK